MKKTMRNVAMVLGLTIAGNALACSMNGKDGFLPENDLYIPVGAKSINTITEAEFNAAIDEVETIYAPIVSSMGATLKIERKWSDGTVNAYATQSGKNWNVAMFGGLARHATITKDAMALVVCHELGHHIGGAPRKAGWMGSSWASNEGQADYFATLKCLRKTWNNDNNEAIARKLAAPKLVTDKCAETYKGNRVETALCIRMSMAGKSVSDLFSVLSNLPATKFETPDPAVVAATNDNHPKAQCRLDTYYSGSLCDISMNEDVSNTDEVKGTCHPTLGHKVGTRPLCWFKPKTR